jgi:hypothetical protein
VDDLGERHAEFVLIVHGFDAVLRVYNFDAAAIAAASQGKTVGR